MSVRVRLSTPPGRASALAVIDLVSESEFELEAALVAIGVGYVDTGSVKLANLAGIDRGLAIRWTGSFAQLTPHGGVAVGNALLTALSGLGIEVVQDIAPVHAFPEARSEVEARALTALGVATSPLAVDLLLAQHDAWRGCDRGLDSELSERDRRLGVLIDPPLIVIAGPANVGKSTLLNGLAGRELSLAADEPGTTRDHVGALIDLGGLVVRWADTPGMRDAQGAESVAISIARELIESADFLIAVGDRDSEDPRSVLGRQAGLVAALRSDLGMPCWAFDCSVSVRSGLGIAEFTAMVRDMVLPPADLACSEPWKFWSGQA
jgi:hypothetical protein